VIGNALNFIIQKAPPKNQLLVAVTLFVWISGFVCAFLDNTAFTLTMIKVIVAMIQGGLKVRVSGNSIYVQTARLHGAASAEV
jgi:Na+/H+ antiporter NhaD/arsenite permease-like protein